MQYISTTLATGWKEKDLNSVSVKLISALLFFIPRANKDNEKYYHLVKYWWLEIDDNGMPVREIGLDQKNNPLFTSPNERNYGLWTDNSTLFDVKDYEQITEGDFNGKWNALN